MRVRINGNGKVYILLGVLTSHNSVRLLQEAKKVFPYRLYACEEEGHSRKYDVPLRRIDVSTESLKALNPSLQ